MGRLLEKKSSNASIALSLILYAYSKRNMRDMLPMIIMRSLIICAGSNQYFAS